MCSKVKDVAARLGLTYRRVIKLIHTQQLNAVNFGSAVRPMYRVPEEAIEEFLAARSTKKRVVAGKPSKYFK